MLNDRINIHLEGVTTSDDPTITTVEWGGRMFSVELIKSSKQISVDCYVSIVIQLPRIKSRNRHWRKMGLMIPSLVDTAIRQLDLKDSTLFTMPERDFLAWP